MEREFIEHHIKEDSGLEHLIASMQPKRHSEDYLKHSMDSKDGQTAPEVFEALEAQTTEYKSTRRYLMNVFRSTRRLQDSTTKSSGACLTRDSKTAHRREF